MSSSRSSSLPAGQSRRRSVWTVAGGLALGFVALLWLLEIVDATSGYNLDDDGVRPRSTVGLLGIAFAPLLHAGWAHLEANTLPALVLPDGGIASRSPVDAMALADLLIFTANAPEALGNRAGLTIFVNWP